MSHQRPAREDQSEREHRGKDERRKQEQSPLVLEDLPAEGRDVIFKDCHGERWSSAIWLDLWPSDIVRMPKARRSGSRGRHNAESHKKRNSKSDKMTRW